VPQCSPMTRMFNYNGSGDVDGSVGVNAKTHGFPTTGALNLRRSMPFGSAYPLPANVPMRRSPSADLSKWKLSARPLTRPDTPWPLEQPTNDVVSSSMLMLASPSGKLSRPFGSRHDLGSVISNGSSHEGMSGQYDYLANTRFQTMSNSYGSFAQLARSPSSSSGLQSPLFLSPPVGPQAGVSFSFGPPM